MVPIEPTAPAPPAPPRLQPVGLRDPWRWLRAGARDLRAAPGVGCFYGLCFWAMAVIVAAVFRRLPEYTMSFISGCFLVGPFLAMGLYDTSRRLEAKQPPNLAESLGCWVGHVGSMGMLVLVLMVLELLWGRASLVVFAVFFNTGLPATTHVVEAIFNPDNWEFVAVYMLVGSVFAGLVFSTCVVSIPMILDRDTDAISAGIASFQAVLERTGPMLLWGALILFLLAAALATPFAFGVLAVGPWLGHASWHAYRGCYGGAGPTAR